MSAEKNLLVNKLILLTLVLILACLVVLIVRQNTANSDAKLTFVAQTVEEETSAPEAEQPRHLPSTNQTARKAAIDNTRPVASADVQPSPAGSLDIHPPAAHQPAPTALVNPPSHPSASTSGGEVSPGTEIAGYVRLSGTPPPEVPIVLDATCGRFHTKPIATRHYVRSEDGGLADVFVYIKTALQEKHFLVPTNAVVLDNIGCLFEPYVLGVQTGQKIQFRNSDPLLHNVHATTTVNRDFNFALPRKDQSVEKIFRVPEVFVRLKCDVHPWMFAYVGVVRHPLFAVTDDEGGYRLPLRVPPGHYTIAAVHPKAGEVAQEVKVRETGRLRLDFTLEVPANGSAMFSKQLLSAEQ